VCRAAAGSRRPPRQSSGVASLWGWGCARSGRHRASCRRGCLPNRTDELAAAVQAAKSSEGRMAGEPPMNKSPAVKPGSSARLIGERKTVVGRVSALPPGPQQRAAGASHAYTPGTAPGSRCRSSTAAGPTCSRAETREPKGIRVGNCPAAGSTTACSACQPCIQSRYRAGVALLVRHCCGARMCGAARPSVADTYPQT
jgi:hypothetical protein